MTWRSVVGTALMVAGAFVPGLSALGQFAFFAGAAAVNARDAHIQRGRARRAARDAWNASVTDRFVMLERAADQARTLCLGRVRNVEGIRRYWTSGDNDEYLTLIVSFAGHEIDAFEAWYLNDLLVTLDGSGYVQEAPYMLTARSTGQAIGTLDGSGAASLTLPLTPIPGAVSGVWTTGTGDSVLQGPCTVGGSGTSVTLSGGQPGADYVVVYEYTQATSHVRIRAYTGAPGQNVGDDIAAEFPGKITSADEFAGIACAVVTLKYNQDVFPQGYPAVAPVFRGAKCFDPRDDTTAWSDNPVLCALRYAEWYSGWNLDRDLVDGIDAAADVCDEEVDFDVAGDTVTLPRYRCGIVIAADADHAAAMDSILATMAGRAGWAGGRWVVRAGAMAAPVMSIDEAWFVTADGAEDEPIVTASNAIAREQRINRVTGTFVDPDQRYQLLPFPAVEDAVLVAAKGERPSELTLDGVNHIAHAQYLGKVAIREAQAGLRLELSCDIRAVVAQLFDVVELSLTDYGLADKTCEVIGWQWAPDGGVMLRMAEITEAIFDADDELQGRDPAPDSGMRPPWDVDTLEGLAVTSGSAALADGSIVTRTEVTWDAAEDVRILQGGRVEVQYTPVDDFPNGDWAQQREQGDATRSVIVGLLGGRHYVFRARFVQTLPEVRGAWGVAVLHEIAARPLVPTSGIEDEAATEVTMDAHDFAGATTSTGPQTQRTVSVTPPVDCLIEFSAKLTATNVDGDSGNQLAWTVTPSGGGATTLGGADGASAAKREFTALNTYAATGGVALDFKLISNRSIGNPAMALYASYMRITQIKR